MREIIKDIQASWFAEFGRLDEIAVDVYHGKRGSFVKVMADAWLRADPTNKRILHQAWVAIVTKYDLEADPTGTGSTEPSRARANGTGGTGGEVHRRI